MPSLRRVFAFGVLLGALAFVASSVGCDDGSCGGEAECTDPGVEIDVRAGTFAAADAASITASGVCVAPKNLCDSSSGNCDATDQKMYGWSIFLKVKAEGDCKVRVVLKDGSIFTGSTTVSDGSGCCPGPYGDKTIEFPASK